MDFIVVRLGVVIAMLLTQAVANAQCRINTVVVKGRVTDVPDAANVRVQLLYSNGVTGETGDISIARDHFTLPIDFLTQSRRPIINGSFGKCGRRPKTVIVTLTGGTGNTEYDRVTLDFVKDFKTMGLTTYVVNSDVVLHGPH